ncbi:MULTISPECIES: ATP-binding cassette domain-containing protein [Leuconostoc]|uniref:Oligopeptide transport ATP-binding protein OppF (TC 3.A.1.5.1) n=2 Tax=Leuconostoc TaxID=1243 RepID=A0AAN2UG33_9LACO|nr:MULTISPECIES: ATP-binding cassette domain-containing protein [Leuconostoc]MBZ5947799.1 ABC transporter ATP-binding protein [Leuconostoc gasicomitatum]MBZ5955711.1 ABC transporter ATP-binding protein [Leuconostoc gasicomitatum]MBZ5956812.1 ABC transporter ATP-binding protein [Leuconostoc gasicomitatum]MBZ5958686.1 ABC transporter ATP-binding protein [Leuconostoc gasicomitatum]MBZ5960669.1 ABC transporter ATP-binding protein [Leuconostoc gasicomitatum]
MSELVRIENLKVYYPIRTGFFNRVTDNIKAVDNISFTIESGQTYGLVGESGSGKTTIGKSLVGLEDPTSGKILFEGHEVTTNRQKKAINYNKDVQMVFQDSQSSLNPRKTIGEIIAEPLKNFGVPNVIGAGYDGERSFDQTKINERVLALLKIVGLPAQTVAQYPFQFSGGQRQRIGVARALATNPRLIVADEPVSALDLSVQAQVLNFMKKIQREYGISFLFISHDLGVVKYMTDNIAIMHNGRFVEMGTTNDIFNDAQHIYTKRLLSAIPSLDVSKRDEKRAYRKRIESEFTQNKGAYYQQDGLRDRAYDLEPITKTHYVALKKEGA